jgi:predicted nucleic acid-binding protein
LVKAYVDEDGTPNVESAIAIPGVRRFATDFVALEVLATLGKKRRGGDLTPERHRAAVAEFRRDYPRHFDIVEVEPAVRDDALRFAEKYHGTSIGSLDLLHLASARRAAVLCRPMPLVLISADGSLLDAARSETLATYNPEVEPHGAVRAALRRPS